jgi:3-deoxy-manno-octulosonate cytidylyltransferase (CMP-KDO synthetase)
LKVPGLTGTHRPRTVGVVPARLASSRFPEKVLKAETGKPLVVHVLEQARKAASLDEVVVAADHQRIVDAVEAAGGRAILTREDHPNGTSRLAEVSEVVSADVFVNIQGDEPEIEPETIDAAVELLHHSPWAEVATVATPFAEDESPNDPNLVKVVLGAGGRALYFSRAPIPFHRDAASGTPPRATPLRHVGLYVYRTPFLQTFLTWPPSALEETESLEQLRILERGHGIAVAIRSVASHGIDTAEQYAAFVSRHRAGTSQHSASATTRLAFPSAS